MTNSRRANNICSDKTFHQMLKIERSRTHRNGHEFTLIVFDIKALQVDHNTRDRVIETINNQARIIDQVGWYDWKRIGVILPYTSAEGAKEFSKKIIDSINFVHKETTYTMVTYPPKKSDSNQ
jgi:PleD family two-component response regulator